MCVYFLAYVLIHYTILYCTTPYPAAVAVK
jgi:hypothetical protein